jgi:putative MATE family efflux protein
MAARDLSVGPIPKLVVVLALPVLATFVLQSLYALADLYFVGRLGGAALAGLGISLNTFFLVLAVGQAVGTGGLAMLAQTYGRGDHARVPHLFQQVFWLSTVIGLLFWVGGFLLARPFVAAFTQDPAVLEAGVSFFRIYCGTFFTQVVMIALSFSFRAVGDFIIPTAIMGASVLLNVGLDIPLIFGFGPIPALGVAGAGLATLISQFAGLAAYLRLVYGTRRNTLLVVRLPLKVDFRVMGQMLKIGLPAGLQYLLFTATLLITYRYARPFGEDVTASISVGFRILQCAYFPAVAIGAAVSSLVGQNYGARMFSRVRAALGWGLLYMAIVMSLEYALILSNPNVWVAFFAKESSIVGIGAEYLVISGAILPFYGISMVTTFGSQGLGRTIPPLLGVAVRFVISLGGLVVLDQWFGLTVAKLFWTGTLAMFAEMGLMALVLIITWRTVLRHADGSPAPVAGMARAPQPAPAAE